LDVLTAFDRVRNWWTYLQLWATSSIVSCLHAQYLIHIKLLMR